jgi:hypothetical protein
MARKDSRDEFGIREPLAKFIVLPVLEIAKNANLLIRLA